MAELHLDADAGQGGVGASMVCLVGDKVRKGAGGTGGGKIGVRCLLDLLKVGYVIVKVDEGRSIIWI